MAKSELIDEGFESLRKLQITKDHPELLHVNQEAWQKQLYKYERKANIGCVFLFMAMLVCTVILGILEKTALNYFIFVAGVICSLVYKISNAKKANNLQLHGRFQYEIHPEKVVRYSNNTYTICHYKDLKEVRVKPYGMILKRDRKFLDKFGLSVYRISRKSQFVIPRQLYAYDQVKTYIRNRLGQREHSR